jgi:hypothetical protein
MSRFNQFLNPEFAKQVEDAMIRKNAELVPNLAYSGNSDNIADAMAKALSKDLVTLAALENNEACQENKHLAAVADSLINVADRLDALGLTKVATCVDSALLKLAGCECTNPKCECSGRVAGGFCGCEGNCYCEKCNGVKPQKPCGKCQHEGKKCTGRGCDCICGNCAMKGRCADDGLSTDAAEMLDVIKAALIDTSDKLDSLGLKNVSDDIDQALAVMASECSCC